MAELLRSFVVVVVVGPLLQDVSGEGGREDRRTRWTGSTFLPESTE